MRWLKDDLEHCISLLKAGKTYNEIAEETNRTAKSVKEKLNRNGFRFDDYRESSTETKKCLNCDKAFEGFISDERKFCSSSCSAIYNNKLRAENAENNKQCLNCGEIVINKFCNNKCQHEYELNNIFNKIENGDTTLSHRQYKKYLIHKYGEKCMECGWVERNKTTNNIPIELEHIDGDSTNNTLENLKLLCPNCHSLTPTYKALNKGNGRHKRMRRYKEGKSY